MSNLISVDLFEGAAVMLTAQKPVDFEREEDDFLPEMGCSPVSGLMLEKVDRANPWCWRFTVFVED